MTTEDQELNVMRLVHEALAPLDQNVALRVVRWAYERSKEKVEGKLAPGSAPLKSAPQIVDPLEKEPGNSTPTNKTFEDLPALYDAANPTTESERALIVGFWLQEEEGNDGFYSYSVNLRLKGMGYQIGNITKAFDSLMNAVPRLVIQVGRGETPQARKKLKLTTEGIRRVEAMLRQNPKGKL